MARTEGRWRKVWIRLFQALLTAVLLVAVTEGVFYFLASRKEKAVLDRWAAYGGGTLEESFAALPRHGTNETAKSVEAAAERMGLVKKSDAAGGASYPSLPPSVTDYGLAQAANPDSRVEPPPEEVAAALAERAEGLRDLRRILESGPPPRWASEPDKLYAAPIPPLLPTVNFNRLLAADAYAALAAGDPGRAMADAEAGWALTRPLFDRPELISKYVAMAGVRMWLPVLRKTASVPETWAGRLAEVDIRKQIAQSLRYEALNSFYMARQGGADLTTVGVLQSGFSETLQMPIFRLMLYDSVLHTLDLVDALERQEPCSGPYEAVTKAVFDAVPRWNLIARIAMPNLSEGWTRMERFRLDAELTEKVIQLKSLRGADGAWPAPPEGFERSYCTKARWLVSTEGGTLVIAMEGAPEAPEKASWATIPLRYEEAPPALRK